MSSSSHPSWFRLDTGILDSPKIRLAIDLGGQAVFALYVQGIAYSTQHLTSGFVPHEMPRRWGMRPKQCEALELAGLWHPTPLDPGDGWLIHDYSEYNPTKEVWERVSERKRRAARKRWDP